MIVGVCCVYEQPAIREITGDAIHPGGLALTDATLHRCDLPANARILDVGCGVGATVEHLRETRQCQAVGIDPSEVLLGAAHQRCANLLLALSRCERDPGTARRRHKGGFTHHTRKTHICAWCGEAHTEGFALLLEVSLWFDDCRDKKTEGALERLGATGICHGRERVTGLVGIPAPT